MPANPLKIKLVILLYVIYLYNSCRKKSNLSRAALVQPKDSAWNRLYRHGDDSSFLKITGFTRHAFEMLRSLLFDEERVHRGRTNTLESHARLGMLLLYLGSRMELKYLCMIFGVTPSTASRNISKVMRIAISKLESNHFSAIRFPDQQEMAEFAALVKSREPEVSNVIGFVDGLACPVQCSDDLEEQAKNYNGYHHDTTCNNVFAFSPKGKVMFACINFPGSWHDTHVASSLIEIVIERIGEYALCVDQGFPRRGAVEGKLVGPLSKKRRRNLPIEERDEALRKHALYISLRQAAEWGMRALQATFTRLKSRMCSNKETRRSVILCCVLLHNFRTEIVGLNQIQTVFDPEYCQFINIEGYDRIARYFA